MIFFYLDSKQINSLFHFLKSNKPLSNKEIKANRYVLKNIMN